MIHLTLQKNDIRQRKPEMTSKPNVINLTLILLVLLVYLFVSAPPELDANKADKILDSRDALSLVNKLNGVARKLYTNRIVKKGKKAGLKFAESWKQEGVDAFPLPAQFLRLTARALESSMVPLGLYLGSDYPINSANKFKGLQSKKYEQLTLTRQQQYFYEQDTERFYFMAEDVAMSSACVSCHNKHKDSPKTDWVLNDIMGATTWSYPDKQVSYAQLIAMTVAYYRSVESAYSTFLEKIAQFKGRKPLVTEQWPVENFIVPDLATFMTEYKKQAGEVIFNELVKLESKTKREIL